LIIAKHLKENTYSSLKVQRYGRKKEKKAKSIFCG